MAEPKFHQLHYNFVAKRLRNHYPPNASSLEESYAQRIVEDIALEFALRFKADNLNFDQYAFLDQCSPDPNQFPLSELWEDLN